MISSVDECADLRTCEVTTLRQVCKDSFAVLARLGNHLEATTPSRGKFGLHLFRGNTLQVGDFLLNGLAHPSSLVVGGCNDLYCLVVCLGADESRFIPCAAQHLCGFFPHECRHGCCVEVSELDTWTACCGNFAFQRALALAESFQFMIEFT